MEKNLKATSGHNRERCHVLPEILMRLWAEEGKRGERELCALSKRSFN